MRSQRLAAKAGRPKRRAAAKSHLIKYQLASNPTRAEESDLKKALEESLKDTQQQKQHIQNGITTPATTTNFTSRKQADATTPPLSTAGSKRKNASNQSQVNMANIVASNIHKTNNFNNNSSYSDASRSNNTTTSSSSSMSTPTSSSSFIINNNVHKLDNSIVINGIETTILSPSDVSSKVTTPITYSKRTRSANSSNYNSKHTNNHKQQPNSNNISSINNNIGSSHTQTQMNDHDKNSYNSIDSTKPQQQKQPHKRAKLIDKAIETIHKINNSKQNYLNNNNNTVGTSASSTSNKKNDTTITNGNGYTTNLCDPSSSFASCSTFPTSVNLISNNINNTYKVNTASRPLRTYSRDKSISNNTNITTISNGVQTVSLPNSNLNNFSLAPSSSTPISCKPQSSRNIVSNNVTTNKTINASNAIGNLNINSNINTKTMNKKVKKKKKKKRRESSDQTTNTSSGVSRSTQTMGLARVIVVPSQAQVQPQNGSIAILQNGMLKVPVDTLAGASNCKKTTFSTSINTPITNQESNQPFKSILKNPTPDANPPPHINSSGVTTPYLYSKRESKNDAYAKMTALKVSQSKSPSGHSKQSSTSANTSRPSTPVVTHQAKTVTMQSTRSPPVAATPSNWSLLGLPEERLIYLRDDEPVRRLICYPAIKHIEGDVIHVRDSVLLRSGAKNTDLPYIAKISAFWEDAETGNVMMSLYWYYRPEHTEEGRKKHHLSDEIFASRHRDVDSVECIEDKCYVLTFNEYCRYKKRCKMEQYNVPWSLTDVTIPVSNEPYPRRSRIPDSSVSQELIFCCRQIYDSRLRRLMKNPLISPKYGHY